MSIRSRTWLAWLALSALAGTAQATGPTNGSWTFRVLLDGATIGEHQFELQSDGAQRKVMGTAAFDVKLLGITLHRYRHKDSEAWADDCLVAMNASTDDGGKHSAVQVSRNGDSLSITGPSGTRTVEGCLMSFAYWNPAIRQQTRLLNAQNGKLESVQMSRVEESAIEVRGQSVKATRWRITGAEQPVDVWYSEQDDWIGLDASLKGGHKLSYRLP